MYVLQSILIVALNIPLKNLQNSLLAYLESGSNEAFDISEVSKAVEITTEKKNALSMTIEEEKPEIELPDFGLGDLILSSPASPLTEQETAYQVSIVKHIYHNHVLLQYNCTNTIDEHLLKDVTVEVEPTAPGWEVEQVVGAEVLEFGKPQALFAVLSKPEDPLATCSFYNTLRFNFAEIDLAVLIFDYD